MANLPPQAYTRDTLSKAYEWIRDQPPHIQELGRNADTLVSLYLQARRRGGSFYRSGETPSTQSFKSDLKNLAQDLKQFEGGSGEISLGPTPRPQAEISNGEPELPVVDSDLLPTLDTDRPDRQPRSGMTPRPAASFPSGRAAPGPSVPAATPPANVAANSPRPSEPPRASIPPPSRSSPPTYSKGIPPLDDKSLATIHMVQERMNLGSEAEALRMLIALGYERVRDLLPRD